MIATTASQNCGVVNSGHPGPARAKRYSNDCSSLPISDGLRVTRIPHASIIASFSWAVPFPPEMIAPACPMRLPGGAVTPAMKPTTGFFMCPDPVGGGFFVGAADLADHDDRVGVRIVVEQPQHVDVLQTIDRIAADADRGRLPEPSSVS